MSISSSQTETESESILAPSSIINFSPPTPSTSPTQLDLDDPSRKAFSRVIHINHCSIQSRSLISISCKRHAGGAGSVCAAGRSPALAHLLSPHSFLFLISLSFRVSSCRFNSGADFHSASTIHSASSFRSNIFTSLLHF